MSTRYLEILSMQRPFPTSVDANQRHIFSVNFMAQAAAPVADFEGEMAKLIANAGLGTKGTDLFIGPLAPIPTGDGPYTTIIDTGGMSPLETHDGALYERLTFQVLVRAKSYTDARTRVLAIWRALDGQRNVTVAA